MKPKRIFLIRHGESEGNIDKNIYHKKPDYALTLTETGISQAKEAGNKIKKIINNEDIAVYYSPFFRSRQTMETALKTIKNKAFIIREEVRLREQEWSNGLRRYDYNTIETERDSFGHFFYRIQGGESCADVYDRISDFLNSLYRDFQKDDFPNNVLIFGHGTTNRVFLMRFLHVSVEEFEFWANPKNGELFILQLQDNGKYKLITELRKYESKTHSYQYPKELI